MVMSIKRNCFPGFINNKIIPAGSWCCRIKDKNGFVKACIPYIRTNMFFASSGCSFETVFRGGKEGTLLGCPQNVNTCCSQALGGGCRVQR